MKPAVFDYKSEIWKAARLAACQRANWRCQNCGCNVRAKHQARVDHIEPVRDNIARALDPNNLRVLCPRCDAARHAEKGNRTTPRQPVGLDGFPE